MMIHLERFDQREESAFRTTIAFLRGRLGEANTIEWALALASRDRPQRAAITRLLDSPAIKDLPEPWKEAWRLIEESWSRERHTDDNWSDIELRRRLESGERSSFLIEAIVSRVSARLRVGSFSRLDQTFRTAPKKISKVTDLFSVRITSGRSIDPQELGVTKLKEAPFLFELATALDQALLAGISDARRMGWDPDQSLWRLGGLNRVYFVPSKDRPAGEHEPDEFNEGIAPTAKLLHAVVARLGCVDPRMGQAFIERWRQLGTSILDRLWASMAPSLSEPDKIFSFMNDLPQDRFWDAHRYPEIAELRATEFRNLEPEQKRAIASRIKKGPPRRLWHRDVKPANIDQFQRQMVLQEFRRIELGQGDLPSPVKEWYLEQLALAPEIQTMSRIDEGFPGTAKAHSIPANPDRQYDSLAGLERLRALERGLRSQRATWHDDPAGRGADWIRSAGNSQLLLDDLEQAEAPGEFPQIWDRFGWAHDPSETEKAKGQGWQRQQASRVAAILLTLPQATLLEAIEGLSWWLQAWSKYLKRNQELLPLWRNMWPAAVEATNAEPNREDIEFTVETASEKAQAKEIDTLNNPVGRLVGIFLEICPNLNKEKAPFRPRTRLRAIRDLIATATGRSYLIATHRLLEGLQYFLKADRTWTQSKLLSPLKQDSDSALILWHAISRRTHFKSVLRVIGGEMADRTTDLRLSRSTREALVFSLVVESLHALKERRKPAVAHARIQQVLRSVEDEVRAHGAEVLQQFLREVSQEKNQTRELIFENAIAQFLSSVWPQERSLSTPGVSRAFADLPVATGNAFAQAVQAVSRFLVPFDAWSSLEYGLYTANDDRPKLDVVDNEEKAAALLDLLDATIGTAEGSVIPHDLSEMLAHIRKLAPRCAHAAAFRRLATAARI